MMTHDERNIELIRQLQEKIEDYKTSNELKKNQDSSVKCDDEESKN